MSFKNHITALNNTINVFGERSFFYEICHIHELNIDILIIKNGNIKMFLAKQVLSELGYSGDITTIGSDLVENYDYIKFIKKTHRQLFDELLVMNLVGSRASEIILLTEIGLDKLLLRSNKPFVQLAYQYLLNKPVPKVLKLLKEQSAMEVILSAYPNMFLLQYNVKGYRIDAYSPKYKIAIECDERNHIGRHQYDKKREREIESYLGNVNWVRFNPDEPNFNIGKVINILNSLIYGNI